MRGFQLTSIILAFLLAAAAGAEDLDGSKPMECLATKGHDCPADKNQCTRLKPEGDKKPVLGIDVGAKTVKTPYRTSLLPIMNVQNNEESLVLQGTNLQFAWSALIKRKTGEMTVSIADRKGVYVIFGQRKIAGAAPPG